MANKLIQKINTMRINWGDTCFLLSSIELINNGNVNIHPNPLENKLTVNSIGFNTNWTIYDCLG